MKTLILPNDILLGEVIEMLRQGKNVTIPVKGSSMLPFIREGRDKVILQPVCATSQESTDVSVGDIILFRFQGRYILHRIVSFDGDQVIVQGDGVCNRQESCTREAIYGRVVSILRDGSTPVDPNSDRQIRYARIWSALAPVRKYLLAIYRRIC